MRCTPFFRDGFSLVELSIVLVILGLLVGGVLSGKSLIAAAEIRSQISQLQSYTVAVRTFKDKYFALPGDLAEPTASSAGFKPRGAYAGQGDANGILECSDMNAPNRNQLYYQCGENLLFWTDLSKAGLIPGSYTAATYQVLSSTATSTSSPSIADYVPKAKLNGNYVLVTGGSQGLDSGWLQKGKSYFTLQAVDSLYVDWIQVTTAHLQLSVAQAYAIDSKMDDAMPHTGKVAALLQSSAIIYILPPLVTAAAASSTSCADNSNNAANPWMYSMSVDNGEGKNCGLFFEMVN